MRKQANASENPANFQTREVLHYFKKNYNNARSKYSKGDVSGAEKLLSKIPTEYVRYRALDEYMYGDPGNMRKVRFYKEYH